ncbi:unnamed protein product [Amaranthus hypochondriacus]
MFNTFENRDWEGISIAWVFLRWVTDHVLAPLIGPVSLQHSSYHHRQVPSSISIEFPGTTTGSSRCLKESFKGLLFHRVELHSQRPSSPSSASASGASFFLCCYFSGSRFLRGFVRCLCGLARSPCYGFTADYGRGWEWGSRTGQSGLFAQKSNAINPYFWKMIQEIANFISEVIM